MSNVPEIKPYKTKEYKSKQSKYDHVGKLPARQLLLGPSGTGKTVVLTNLILDVYRGCFEKIFIWSPTIFLDDNWNAVKNYIEKEMKQEHSDKDPMYFDYYDPKDMDRVINTQEKVVQYMKKNKYDNMFHIALIVDDFSDTKEVARNSVHLMKLYCKGRHYYCSTFVGTQVWMSLSPVLRKNVTQLYVFRLRNQKDLDSLLEELSALYDKATLLQMYKLATDEKHSFLFIDLMQPNKEDMFYKKLNQKIIMNDE